MYSSCQEIRAEALLHTQTFNFTPPSNLILLNFTRLLDFCSRKYSRSCYVSDDTTCHIYACVGNNTKNYIIRWQSLTLLSGRIRQPCELADIQFFVKTIIPCVTIQISCVLTNVTDISSKW